MSTVYVLLSAAMTSAMWATFLYDWKWCIASAIFGYFLIAAALEQRLLGAD